MKPYCAKGSTLKKRILAHKYVNDLTGCWLWIGAKTNKGYGKLTISTGKTGGKIELAHRLAWIAFKGQIPKDMCVLHRCDVPQCVNPGHLFLGTKKDNTQDCIAKGRWKCRREGEQSNMAKLTTSKVRWIRSNSAKWTQARIAEFFGITQSAVSRIVTKENWRHVS